MTIGRVDAIGDQSTAPGTSDFVIDGVALTGMLAFAGKLTDGYTYRYRAQNADNSVWEVGGGVWTAATTTLSRVTTYQSSNGGAKANFTGTTAVVVTMTAADFADAATDANISMSDITTNDVSITKHGFVPKAPNDAVKYLNGLGAWATVSGMNLGANTFTDVQTVSEAVAATSTDGVVLATTATATVGAQKYSPRIRWTGSGWKTTATAAAQTVDFIAEAVPVQGAANPTVNLVISSQINGGGYTPRMTVQSNGSWKIGGVYISESGGVLSFGNGADLGTDGNLKAARYRDDTNQVAVGAASGVAGLFNKSANGAWWTNDATWYGTIDLGVVRSASGVGAVLKSTTTSDFGDWKARNLISIGGVITLSSFTVATLPSAATSGAGATVFVTDASTTLILGLGTTVTGGGANKVPVYSDATNWIYG